MKNINFFRFIFCIAVFVMIFGFSGCAKKQAKVKGNFVGERCETICDISKCNQVCTNVEGEIR